MDDSAVVAKRAADSATESVRNATAVLRSIASKLRNPVPARLTSLDGGWLLPLLTPLQQQLPMLEFNPLIAQSPSDVAVGATQKPAAQPVAKKRTAAHSEMVNALLAGAASGTAAAAAKVSAKAGVDTVNAAVAGALATMANKNAASNVTSRKFALVKPGAQSSMQDVGKLIADLMSQPVGSQVTPVAGVQLNQNTSAQKKSTSVAPRVASGNARSGASTLAHLLQQLETLTADAVTNLVTGEGMLQTLTKDKAGTTAKKAAKVSPQQSLALQQLSKLVADVLQQANQAAGRSTTRSPARKSLPAQRSDEHTNASSHDEVSGAGKASASQPATVPVVVGGVINDDAHRPDMHALAEGINDVLREQAWLAGVDVL